MNRKIRVLHVLKSSVYSGAENIAITIIRHLDERFEARYLATRGDVEKVLKQEAIQYFLLDRYSRNNIRQVIKMYAPDIIHAHDFTATVLCASLKGQFKLISHLHYDPPWTCRWNWRTITFFCIKARIDRILIVSSGLLDNMIFEEKIKKKAVVLTNPLDIERILVQAERAPLNIDISCDIVFVGRLVEQKNPQRFIRLVSDLRKNGLQEIKCNILGEGELLAECRKLVGELELEDSICFTGFQSNPYPYIKHAKLLCMTSRWEGYGLVIAEANVLGIPVLSTMTSGSNEILGQRTWEACKSDEDFVKKGTALLTDEIIYAKQKQKAIQRASTFQNSERYIKKLELIYSDEVKYKC